MRNNEIVFSVFRFAIATTILIHALSCFDKEANGSGNDKMYIHKAVSSSATSRCEDDKSSNNSESIVLTDNDNADYKRITMNCRDSYGRNTSIQCRTEDHHTQRNTIFTKTVSIEDTLKSKGYRDSIYCAVMAVFEKGGPEYNLKNESHSEFYRIADISLKWFLEQDEVKKKEINDHYNYKLSRWSPIYPETVFILSESNVASVVDAIDCNKSVNSSSTNISTGQ